LFWKPKQHSTIQLLYKPTQHNSLCSGNQTQNTRIKQHPETKKSQKESNNSKSTNPKENVLFNTDFQSTTTTTMKFQQQQQI
jgi:hypothetical protein